MQMILDVERKYKKLEICFSSTTDNIDIAAMETEKFLAENSLKDIAFDVILVMREALINAVKYGSGENLKKKIKYSLKNQGNFLVMKVEDEGEGFDWKKKLKQGIPMTDSSNGRGLAIMKSYFHIIEYNKKGNILTLHKKILNGGANGKKSNKKNI